MTHRNPPARIRWNPSFAAWGVTSNTAPNDTILTCNWDDAIEVANNSHMAPTEKTSTYPDGTQAVHFYVRTHP